MAQYTYLIVNPFAAEENGVTAYTDSLRRFLHRMQITNIRVEALAVTEKLPLEELRQYVAEKITKSYGHDEVLIEVPETRAASMYIPRPYRVHVRLHCPLYVAQRYNLHPGDEARYSDELRVINQASVVSSPSWGLLREMADNIDQSRILVFKNPVNTYIRQFRNREKKYDVVFMGRIDNLKGADFLNPILRRLPAHYSVLVFGRRGECWDKTVRDPSIACRVEVLDHVSGDDRFRYLAASKVSIVPSRFENCSMAILESLAVATPVVAWHVGGNDEIAEGALLRLAPFGDVDAYVSHIIDLAESPSIDWRRFDRAAQLIADDFQEGFKTVLSCLTGEQTPAQKQPKTFLPTPVPTSEIIRTSLKNHRQNGLMRLFGGLKIFGFSISNEHIEEMWMPVIYYLGADYRFVTPRQLGHMVKFAFRYPIDPDKIDFYSWEHHPDRLIEDIRQFAPDIVFFHNGLHPRYKHILQYIRDKVNVPFVYTELGWLPQRDHIYFDPWGANAKSFLASLSAERLTGRTDLDDSSETMIQGDYTLIIGQVESDTNILISSPRFRSMENFIAYVLSQLPDTERVIIKPHPLERKNENLDRFVSERVSIVTDQKLDTLLPKAKAVVGINSTAFFEALAYPINVYAFGFSILSNKGVLIDCTEKPLSQLWTNRLFGSLKRRKAVLDAFAARQIHTTKLIEKTPDWAIKTPALDPLLYALDLGAPRHALFSQKAIDNLSKPCMQSRVFPLPKETPVSGASVAKA